MRGWLEGGLREGGRVGGRVAKQLTDEKWLGLREGELRGWVGMVSVLR